MHAQPFLVQISTVVCAVACVVVRANTERPLPDRTVMCVPGKIIFTDDFDPDTFSDRWGFKEDFALRDGALLRTEIHPSESKRVFLKDARFQNAIIQFDFRLSGKTSDLRLVTGSGGHYNSVTQIHRNYFQINTASDRDAGFVPTQLGECIRMPRPDQWQTMTIEYWANEMVAHVSDTEIIVGAHPIVDRTRLYCAFQFDLPGASIDNVHIWEAARQLDNWKETRKKLTGVQRSRTPVSRTPVEQYKLECMNLRSRLMLEHQDYRDLVATHDSLQSALQKTYPEAFISHKQLSKRIAQAKKQIKENDPNFKKMEQLVHHARRAEDTYVVSLAPQLNQFKADGIPKQRFASELGQVRGQLEAAGDEQLARLVAKTAERQRQLEAEFPEAFQSVDAAVEQRRAIRKALTVIPEFAKLNQAVVDAGKAIKAYEHQVAPNLAELEVASKAYMNASRSSQKE